MNPDQVNPVNQSLARTLRVNVALYVAVLLVAFGAVLAGVFLVWPEVQADDGPGAQNVASQPTKEDVPEVVYHDVLTAARAEALAFVNLDYRDISTSTEAVLKGATGGFADQYEASEKGLRTLMKRNRSVMEGEVLSAGVVAASEFTARVLVATNGTVRNKSTGGKKVERNLRLQLDMTKSEGRWLVNDLQFVG
ncbi:MULTISPECIES: hypothetical protein [unclassified Nocardioides]|uniref:hypothetical protein n=1 Tax=unclassified Nocardioides TaxID=2615069 RepID=UPI000AACBAFA|nr:MULTISPECIES: hypothetical protein [unclassified Nocardioides]